MHRHFGSVKVITLLVGRVPLPISARPLAYFLSRRLFDIVTRLAAPTVVSAALRRNRLAALPENRAWPSWTHQTAAHNSLEGQLTLFETVRSALITIKHHPIALPPRCLEICMSRLTTTMLLPRISLSIGETYERRWRRKTQPQYQCIALFQRVVAICCRHTNVDT